MTERVELRTERLLLRPFELSDVEDVLAYASDEDWSRYLQRVPSPYARRDAEEFVAGDLNDERGYITNDIGSGHGTHVSSTIIGYQLGPSMWMHGVAPKATVIPVLVLDTWLM